jgi:hypothetical protein
VRKPGALRILHPSFLEVIGHGSSSMGHRAWVSKAWMKRIIVKLKLKAMSA